MLNECRLYYKKNETYLKQIKEFERDYHPTKALDWYTADKFLYRIVNKALRTQLYRGQLLSQADMQRLQKCVGKRMIITQFISTTKNIELAKVLAGNGQGRPDFESVIYEIDLSDVYDKYKDKPDPFKHHSREQLRYYQAALPNIPLNESIFLELGYWAIRMRCFFFSCPRLDITTIADVSSNRTLYPR
ncbi:unnamed protein product [Adineta ricciae]|uniref:Uncharacterized protein n=1 Tax=Adineta ricciae TaxID=249248 RepID=A0A815UGR6_ADIRI|nr:unnamed protein product [Adineta ricciae]